MHDRDLASKTESVTVNLRGELKEFPIIAKNHKWQLVTIWDEQNHTRRYFEYSECLNPLEIWWFKFSEASGKMKELEIKKTILENDRRRNGI
ncbi:hypothetical protein QO206_13420 [Leeuwenhoekiella aequorea]|uniref:hypothetical protein n=1 Tax=Leeuwenhoekiella aequorea TaxID=283736 RepID=UPI00352C5E46|tara:strand:- start:3324 stop:3599 length:276 start_codon:yes stop_codon:yes gene_type:complete